MHKTGTGSKEPKTVDQQLCDKWLDKENESGQAQETKQEKPQETKKVNPLTENVAQKTPALLRESAILSGLDENYIPKDFICQSMYWVQQHPLETILGALVIGGIGYKLYQHFTKKETPQTEQAMKSRLFRARKKRLRERRRTFMEKANDLFHSENDKGERTFELGKTVTALSVAATGALAGVIASEKSLPVTLLGAATFAIAGYGFNNPLVTLGAIGVAVGAFVSELVGKSVKKSVVLEGMDSQIPNPDKETSGITEVKLQERVSAEALVSELNAIEEVQRNEKEHKVKSKEDFLAFDRMMKELQQEELSELV